jgi:hypothetical protein
MKAGQTQPSHREQQIAYIQKVSIAWSGFALIVARSVFIFATITIFQQKIATASFPGGFSLLLKYISQRLGYGPLWAVQQGVGIVLVLAYLRLPPYMTTMPVAPLLP